MQYMLTTTDVSLSNVLAWIALPTLIKVGVGLLVVKVLAVAFGPDGLGQAGNYRQLIMALGVFSGAGIFNGITKLVAEHRNQPEQLRTVLGTGSTAVLGSSLLLASILIFSADLISCAIFGHEQYQLVIVALAIIQLGIACTNLGLAILKGYRDIAGNAFVVSVGSMLGIIAFLVCYRLGDYTGVLIGLALLPVMTILPMLFMLFYWRQLPLSLLSPVWDSGCAALLGKFAIMAIITTSILPVAYVMMRNLLVSVDGLAAVGIWQGLSGISDAYMQFITAFFTVYLLPTLSQLVDKRAIAQEIMRTLRFVLFFASAFSLSLWLVRDVVIQMFFSSEFSVMTNLFVWQLVGDVFKIGAYVFGCLVVARAALRIYFLAEITQFILLIGFSRLLIPYHGALGAIQAYMAAYIVYFTLCSGFFFLYLKKNA